MKEWFKKQKAKLENLIEEARNKIANSQDIAEVRAMGENLQGLYDDLKDVEEQLKSLEENNDEGEAAGEEETKSDDNAADEEGEKDMNRSFNPMGTYAQRTQVTKKIENEDALSSLEYRKAFAEYVRTGTDFDMSKFQKREDALLVTGDIGKVIPNTIMQEFIKEIKTYGSLYNKVRKLNVRGGVEFPIEELVPTVTWITETTVSDEQKAPELKTSVSFGYYIAEAKISQSLLSSIVSLEILEQEIAKLLAEAFVKEFDRIILAGSGNGQPTGILVDARVPSGNKIPFTEAQMADWTQFRKQLFSKIKLAYRSKGVLVMTAATWESNIMTLKDKNDNPLYQETYNPVTGETECRFNGREVILVENDLGIFDFDTATDGQPVMVYFRPGDYGINSNMALGFKRYFDDNKNKWINKGLTIADGKLLDAKGAYIITKSIKA